MYVKGALCAIVAALGQMWLDVPYNRNFNAVNMFGYDSTEKIIQRKVS